MKKWLKGGVFVLVMLSGANCPRGVVVPQEEECPVTVVAPGNALELSGASGPLTLRHQNGTEDSRSFRIGDGVFWMVPPLENGTEGTLERSGMVIARVRVEWPSTSLGGPTTAYLDKLQALVDNPPAPAAQAEHAALQARAVANLGRALPIARTLVSEVQAGRTSPLGSGKVFDADHLKMLDAVYTGLSAGAAIHHASCGSTTTQANHIPWDDGDGVVHVLCNQHHVRPLLPSEFGCPLAVDEAGAGSSRPPDDGAGDIAAGAEEAAEGAEGGPLEETAGESADLADQYGSLDCRSASGCPQGWLCCPPAYFGCAMVLEDCGKECWRYCNGRCHGRDEPCDGGSPASSSASSSSHGGQSSSGQSSSNGSSLSSSGTGSSSAGFSSSSASSVNNGQSSSSNGALSSSSSSSGGQVCGFQQCGAGQDCVTCMNSPNCVAAGTVCCNNAFYCTPDQTCETNNMGVQTCVGGSSSSSSSSAASTSSSSSGGLEPTVLVTGECYPRRIGVNSSSIFWVVATTVRTAPKTGGTGTDLGSVGNISAMKVGHDAIYLATNNETNPYPQFGRLEKIPFGGGATLISMNNNAMIGVSVDVDRVYYTSGIWAEVVSVAHDGTDRRVLATDIGSANELLTDAQNAYWVGDNQGSFIRSVPLNTATGEYTNLALATTGIRNIQQDNSYIYWSASTESIIYRVPKAGGSAEATVQTTGLGGYAVDGFSIFYGSEGGMYRYSLSDGFVELLSTYYDTPQYVAVDDNNVYWLYSGRPTLCEGAVLSTPKFR